MVPTLTTEFSTEFTKDYSSYPAIVDELFDEHSAQRPSHPGAKTNVYTTMTSSARSIFLGSKDDACDYLASPQTISSSYDAQSPQSQALLRFMVVHGPQLQWHDMVQT